MKFACIALSMVLIITGFLFLSSANKPASGVPENVADVYFSSMKEADIYYVEDMAVYGQFAQPKQDAQEVYLLVSFPCKDGSIVAAPMSFHKDNENWDEVNEYLQNERTENGKLTLDCYIALETDSGMEDSKYAASYNEACDVLKKLARSSGDPMINVQRTSWRADYICDSQGDPYIWNKQDNTFNRIVSAACFVVAAIGLYFSVLHKSKKVPKELDPDNGM